VKTAGGGVVKEWGQDLIKREGTGARQKSHGCPKGVGGEKRRSENSGRLEDAKRCEIRFHEKSAVGNKQ